MKTVRRETRRYRHYWGASRAFQSLVSNGAIEAGSDARRARDARGERHSREAAERRPAGSRRAHAPAGMGQAAAAARSADSSVLISSIVIVIGPTPPGTGVM